MKITQPVKVELRNLMRRLVHLPCAKPFLKPVDPVALLIPDYFHIIKKPMDMSTIKKKLENNSYETTADFEGDFDLMCENCKLYNTDHTSPIAQNCFNLEENFKKHFSALINKAEVDVGYGTTRHRRINYNEEAIAKIEKSEKKQESQNLNLGKIIPSGSANTSANLNVNISKGVSSKIQIQPPLPKKQSPKHIIQPSQQPLQSFQTTMKPIQPPQPQQPEPSNSSFKFRISLSDIVSQPTPNEPSSTQPPPNLQSEGPLSKQAKPKTSSHKRQRPSKTSNPKNEEQKERKWKKKVFQFVNKLEDKEKFFSSFSVSIDDIQDKIINAQNFQSVYYFFLKMISGSSDQDKFFKFTKKWDKLKGELKNFIEVEVKPKRRRKKANEEISAKKSVKVDLPVPPEKRPKLGNGENDLEAHQAVPLTSTAFTQNNSFVYPNLNTKTKIQENEFQHEIFPQFPKPEKSESTSIPIKIKIPLPISLEKPVQKIDPQEEKLQSYYKPSIRNVPVPAKPPSLIKPKHQNSSFQSKPPAQVKPPTSMHPMLQSAKPNVEFVYHGKAGQIQLAKDKIPRNNLAPVAQPSSISIPQCRPSPNQLQSKYHRGQGYQNMGSYQTNRRLSAIESDISIKMEDDSPIEETPEKVPGSTKINLQDLLRQNSEQPSIEKIPENKIPISYPKNEAPDTTPEKYSNSMCIRLPFMAQTGHPTPSPIAKEEPILVSPNPSQIQSQSQMALPLSRSESTTSVSIGLTPSLNKKIQMVNKNISMKSGGNLSVNAYSTKIQIENFNALQSSKTMHDRSLVDDCNKYEICQNYTDHEKYPLEEAIQNKFQLQVTNSWKIIKEVLQRQEEHKIKKECAERQKEKERIHQKYYSYHQSDTEIKDLSLILNQPVSNKMKGGIEISFKNNLLKEINLGNIFKMED